MNLKSLRQIGGSYAAAMDDEQLAARAAYYADASHQPSKKLKSKALQAERAAFIAAVRGQQVTPKAAAAAETPKASKQTAWVMVNGKAVELEVVPAPKVEINPIWLAVRPELKRICPKGQLVPEGTNLRFVNRGRLPKEAVEILTLASRVSKLTVLVGTKTL